MTNTATLDTLTGKADGQDLEGYEERAGRFPLKVDFNEEGQAIEGVYRNRETFKGQRGKEVPSHHIALTGVAPGVRLFKNEDDTVDLKTIRPGIMVSLTGAVLDASLKSEDLGHRVRIIYMGLGKKKKGQNPPKLFRVLVGPKA